MPEIDGMRNQSFGSMLYGLRSIEVTLKRSTCEVPYDGTKTAKMDPQASCRGYLRTSAMVGSPSRVHRGSLYGDLPKIGLRDRVQRLDF